MYGTNPIVLDRNTEDQPTNNTDSLIALTGLQPATSYSYQIIRTDDKGTSVTSPIASFTTSNFQVILHFVNDKSEGIEDIEGTIKELDNVKSTSDKDGSMRFSDVPAGSYEVSYTYDGRVYKEPITAGATAVSSDDAAKFEEASLNFFINVDKLATEKSTPAPARPQSRWLPWLLAGAALLVGLIIFALARRRHRRKAAGGSYYDDEYREASTPAEVATPAVTAPAEAPPVTPPVPVAPVTPVPEVKPKPLPKNSTVYLPQDAPEHMGESLKEMVLRSMAEEARKRQQDDGPKKR
jgi:hypothetical protein